MKREIGSRNFWMMAVASALIPAVGVASPIISGNRTATSGAVVAQASTQKPQQDLGIDHLEENATSSEDVKLPEPEVIVGRPLPVGATRTENGPVQENHTEKKSDPQGVRNIYLELSEAESTFPGFKIEIVGEAPNARATMKGKLFNSCQSLGANTGFNIEPYIGDDGKHGFKIKDPGGHVRSCQASEKQTTSCQLEGACKELPVTPWLLPNKSLVLGIVYQDLEKYEWHHQEYPSASIVSTIDLAAQREKELEDRRNKRIDDANLVYDNCHNKASGLNDAREAVEELLSLEAISPEEARDKLSAVDGAELEKIVRKSNSLENDPACRDKIDSLREEASQFAEKHPDSQNKIAGHVYAKMAACALSENGEHELSEEDFRLARELLNEAGDFDEVSSEVNKSLRKFQGEVKMGRLKHLARQGSAGYSDYMRARMKLQQELAKDMRQCSGAMRSMESMMGCQTAQQNYYRVPAMLDAEFNRSIQQEQAMQQQMWQMMNTPMGSGFGGYSTVNGNGFGGQSPIGLNPMVGGAQQPQQFGQQPQQFGQQPQQFGQQPMSGMFR